MIRDGQHEGRGEGAFGLLMDAHQSNISLVQMGVEGMLFMVEGHIMSTKQHLICSFT